jgi:hypothetical protein
MGFCLILQVVLSGAQSTELVPVSGHQDQHQT